MLSWLQFISVFSSTISRCFSFSSMADIFSLRLAYLHRHHRLRWLVQHFVHRAAGPAAQHHSRVFEVVCAELDLLRFGRHVRVGQVSLGFLVSRGVRLAAATSPVGGPADRLAQSSDYSRDACLVDLDVPVLECVHLRVSGVKAAYSCWLSLLSVPSFSGFSSFTLPGFSMVILYTPGNRRPAESPPINSRPINSTRAIRDLAPIEH